MIEVGQEGNIEMSSAYPRQLMLKQLGDEKEWRRHWRALTRWLTNSTVSNMLRISPHSNKWALQKAVFRGVAKQYFGTSSYRRYMSNRVAYRAALQQAKPDFSFCGSDMFRTE